VETSLRSRSAASAAYLDVYRRKPVKPLWRKYIAQSLRCIAAAAACRRKLNRVTKGRHVPVDHAARCARKSAYASSSDESRYAQAEDSLIRHGKKVRVAVKMKPEYSLA
jgi:hypothetical protein